MLIPSNVTLEEYNTALAEETVTHARVTFIVDNVVFQDEELESGGIQLSTYMNPDENMEFGIAYCTEAIIHILKSQKTSEINFAHEFTIEFGVEINDNIEWVKIGHFTGNKPVQGITSDVIELVAYDRMIRMDREAKDFIATLTFPTTIGDIYNDLCEFVVLDHESGDEIADVMNRQITSADILKEYSTCRELLADIAEANGCYAKVDNNGHIKLIWFADHMSDMTLLLDNCFNGTVIKLDKSYSRKWGTLADTKWKDVELIKYSEYDNNSNPFEYSYVRGLWDDGDGNIQEVVQPPYNPFYNNRLWANVENYKWSGVESMKYKEIEEIDDIAGNVYTVMNNPFVHYNTEADIKAHLQYILDKLYNFHLYYVATVSMVGNWLVEPGDTIMLEVTSGEYVEYPVFNRVLYWNGACNCEYETTGTLTGS